MSCEEGPARYALLVQEAGDFDLVHMGMGPDGHTASPFPDGPELDAGPEELVLLTSDPTVTTRSRERPLTFGAFSGARKIVFTIEGADNVTRNTHSTTIEALIGRWSEPHAPITWESTTRQGSRTSMWSG